MNIALCCDRYVLPGLHVTLSTLLGSQSNAEVKLPVNLYILYESLSRTDLESIEETVAHSPCKAVLTLRPFSTAKLCPFASLHGNRMTYARLFLADLFPGIDRMLYLDSDLFVNCAVSELWETDLGERVLGAVSPSTVKWALDHVILTENGLQESDPHFNAGVLLMDLKRWRKEGITEKCVAFLNAYKGRCPSHDQTVLNVHFSRQHRRLPDRFNLQTYPGARPVGDVFPPGISHFVGSPKPWDLFGKSLHGHGVLFYRALDKTAFERPSLADFVCYLPRTLRLARSYYVLLKTRLRESYSAS